jgi:hypothetical protein
MKRGIFSILFALTLVLCVSLVLAAPAGAVGPPTKTFTFAGGSLTTTNADSWGGYASRSYHVHFNIDAGPITIEYLGVNAYPINYTGDFGWPPDPTDTGASVIVGLGDGTNIAQYSFKSNMSGSRPRGTDPETYGKGSWDHQDIGHWNDDGYRSYLFQGQFTGNWVETVGNSQYNAEKHGGPTGTDPDYDTFDIKLVIEKVGDNTYEVTGWHNLWKSSAIDEGCYWDWNYAKNAHDTNKRGYLQCFEGTWTADGGLDLSNAEVFLAIQNWQYTQPELHTFDWDGVVVTGTVVPPSEVLVDDDWAGLTPGDPAGEHVYSYDAFAAIQDGIEAVAVGGTIQVAAGTYAGAIVDKSVKLVGAADGLSVITSGVPYKPGNSSHNAAFRPEADGAEIRNFTINCDVAAKFDLGIYAMGVDNVIIDSLTINSEGSVQGISNWGGSYWVITRNTITNTVAKGGGGIGIFLGAKPVNDYSETPLPVCSNNLVQYNEVNATATAEGYSCPAICVCLDLRYGGYGNIDDTEDVSGNQILNNDITSNGAPNSVGIEVGTILGDSEDDPLRFDLEAIAAIMAAAAVHDNNVQGNTTDGVETGIYFYNVTDLTVTENTIENSVSEGIYAEHGQIGTLITGNIFTNNNVQLSDDTLDTETLDPLDIESILNNNTFDRAVAVDHPGASLLHTVWSKIQDAVDNAIDDDIILVGAGTYEENVNVNKSVTIDGQEAATLIAGIEYWTGKRGDGFRVIASDVTITGFTIIGHYDGIEQDFNNPGIIIGGTFPGDYGNLGVERVTINNNVFMDSWSAIYVWKSSHNLIEGNKIYNMDWRAIQIYDGCNDTQLAYDPAYNDGNSANGEYSNSPVRDWQGNPLPFSPGDLICPSQNNRIMGNEIHNAWGGIFAGAWDPATQITNNSGTIIEGNSFYDLTDPAVMTGYTTGGITINQPGATRWSYEVYDAFNVVNVPDDNVCDSGWNATIQAAINAAREGGTINVAAGTYVEAILIDKPLTLRGATAGVNKNGYVVPAGYAWDDTVESIIMHPNPGSGYYAIVDIVDTDNVTFEGFVVQELNAVGSKDHSLVRVYAHTREISNIIVRNNVIGPFTNTTSQDGTHGRMGLYIVNHPYDTNGVVNSTFSGNKIFGCQGNGNNVFIWTSYYDYGAAGPASMAGTVIEDNEIYGAHRSGIETAGGFSDLIIRNNSIYGNGGPGITGKPDLMFGNGIVMIRGSGDRKNVDGYGPVNITIENNEIYNNEGHSIYMGPNNKGITITGNSLYNNGEDAIIVDLIGNYWNPDFEPDTGPHTNLGGSQDITAQFNNIYDNVGFGVRVVGTPTNGFVLDATHNWWGDNSGPTHVANLAGIGDAVSDRVDYDPWIGAGVEDSKSEKTDPGADTVNARTEADTEVIKSGAGTPTITVAKYDSNPGRGFAGSTGKYIDVHVDDPAGVTEIEIRVYYTDAEIGGLVESSLILRWWDGTRWLGCSDTGVNTTDIPPYSGYIWAKIRNDTIPTLAQLSGTVFGGSGRVPVVIPPSPPAPAPPSPPPGTTDVRGIVSTAGIFLESVTAISEDELCTLTIPEDTVGLTEELEPLTEITVVIMDEPPPPPEDAYIIGLTYDFGPDGATFEPPATLKYTYDPVDIPEDVAEEDLVIAYYNEAAGEWVVLDGCMVDPVADTITAPVGHFTAFRAMVFIPAPAAFSLSGLEVSSAEVEVGSPVTISAVVENTGGERGTCEVTLKINGEVEETKEVALDPGASERVSFTTSMDVAGSYSVDVNELTGSFEVKALPELPSEEAPEAKSSINWPMIGGIIAAGIVVAGLLIFFLVRRRA